MHADTVAEPRHVDADQVPDPRECNHNGMRRDITALPTCKVDILLLIAAIHIEAECRHAGSCWRTR